MAAGRSGIQSTSRGAHKGQGAKARREGLAPLPSLEASVPAVERLVGLEEITGWLGTFRERLRLARLDGVVELAGVAAVVQQLEARYQLRRAELS